MPVRQTHKKFSSPRETAHYDLRASMLDEESNVLVRPCACVSVCVCPSKINEQLRINP